jgi:circadian clock protein KaiC
VASRSSPVSSPLNTDRQASREKLASDVPALDLLLGGGIEEGTSTLIVGAAGTGKSTLASQFAAAAAARGQQVAQFLFDESVDTLLSRCDALQVNLREHIESGTVSLQQIDPAELTPGEFTHAIRRAVESRHAKVIIIDSLNGYLNATPEERFLTIQLHELLMYLSQKSVATIMIGAHQGHDRRADEHAGRCQLPGGCGRSSALLRGPRRGSAGHFGDEEARQ